MRSRTVHGCTFYNGDAIRGAAEHIPDGSIDLIITDPPYGIDGHLLHRHYNRAEKFVIPDYVDVPKEEYARFSEQWIREAWRVLRPGGSIYIVSGYTNLADILNALKKTDLREVNHIIWKFRFGVFTTTKYISSHYHILFYEKPGGRRTFNTESRFYLSEKAPDGTSCNNSDREDVWVINRQYKPGMQKNKNELPPALVTKIIQYSSNEGDSVLDFFLGGFSSAKAAIGLNRRVTGFEISRTVFDAKTSELNTFEPGCLLSRARAPVSRNAENRGSRWSRDDLLALGAEYERLRSRGLLKYQAVAELCRTFKRGRFAIDRALKKYRLTVGR